MDSQPLEKKIEATIAVRFQKTCLHDSVNPRILTNCPSDLSLLTTSRESPDSRIIQLKNFTLKGALNQSITDDLASIQTAEEIP